MPLPRLSYIYWLIRFNVRNSKFWRKWPPRLGLGFGLGLGLVLGGGDNFPRGNCPRTAEFTYQHCWKWSQIYYSIINLLSHEQICLMRLIDHIRWWRYLTINTKNTDENILRYLKFIVISGDARTQKSCDRVSQKVSLQRHNLSITFFYASRTIFFQDH